ncbi:MAG: hypothetical protein ACOCWG_04920 [bacterium]
MIEIKLLIVLVPTVILIYSVHMFMKVSMKINKYMYVKHYEFWKNCFFGSDGMWKVKKPKFGFFNDESNSSTAFILYWLWKFKGDDYVIKMRNEGIVWLISSVILFWVCAIILLLI